LLVAAAAAVVLSGCASAPAGESTCDSAVAGVTPIPGFEGAFNLVSTELAMTLYECESLEEWTAALQRHPDIVDVDSISDEDALMYLAGVCGLLADESEPSNICVEASEAGLFWE